LTLLGSIRNTRKFRK